MKMPLLPFLFLFQCMISTTCWSQLQHLISHPDECSALLSFSTSLTISRNPYSCSNSSYPKTSSWKEGTDCCSWDGVSCKGGGNVVVGLDLSCSWLRGTLSSNSTLFLLQNLENLNLAYNNFSGSQISPNFGVFKSLTHLNLSLCLLGGSVPVEMSYLSKLVSLDLSTNNIGFGKDSFEKLVQNLREIREVDLNRIDMSRASPHSLRNVSSTLTSFQCVSCQLNGILPTNLFNLPNLRRLHLIFSPGLTGTLPSSTNWTSPFLEELIIFGSSFTGPIPESIGNLTRLKILSLVMNDFIGRIPPTFENLEHLTILQLHENNFSGFVDFKIFSKSTNLQSLVLPVKRINISCDVSGNYTFPKLEVLVLRGCSLCRFPYFLTSLERIVTLDLSDNTIDEEIPSWFGSIGKHSLKILFLSNNKIRGVVPTTLFQWKNLTSFDLSGNLLQGPIPDLPPSLEIFEASGNRFSGNIPFSVCQARSLNILHLNNNKLTGTIPSCLGNLNQLGFLEVGDNQLHGPLPRSLDNCTQLWRLNVSYNAINDTFPQWLKPHRFQYLDLQSNKFHGFVQPLTAVPGLQKVELIDLSNNNFEGPLPAPPSTIKYFMVSNNNFSGEFPSGICNATALRILNLFNNSLSGSIPHCFVNFNTSLSVLNLRMNRLNGRIPPEIFIPGNKLRTVDFSENQFEGKLPRSLELSENLEVLNLSHNNIEDSFPNWLEALTKLQVLILRENSFYGHVKSSNKSHIWFPQLHIFDISRNSFTGALPNQYIVGLKAMMDEATEYKNLHFGNISSYVYQDSVRVTMKGQELELVKILTIFTTIDLSSNHFEGHIHPDIGNLKALKGLNFSHNSLTGHIPSSIGNLTNLEWLDLSSNTLTGGIPRKMADMTFLAILNLSKNQLSGPIPTSTQFSTFTSGSFNGNPGLCGAPLPKACLPYGANPSPKVLNGEEEDIEHEKWIEWRAVLFGYGCGTVLGISIGYISLETMKPLWLAKMVEKMIYTKTKRSAVHRRSKFVRRTG